MLRYLGTGGEPVNEIAEKCQGRHRHHASSTSRRTTDDVDQARRSPSRTRSTSLDTEYFSLQEARPVGQHPARMDAKKIKHFDKITPIFTKGELPDGKKIGDQGTAPKKVLLRRGRELHEVRQGADRVDHADPDRLQRRHARHPARPDQARRSSSWKELLEPRVQGQGLDPQHPVDRHHGRRDGRGGHRACTSTPTRAT